LRIVGISSGGGHLTELLTITGHLPQLTALITENGAVKRNDGSGLPLQPILDPHRSLVGFFRNTFQSVRYLQRYKPDVVISTGAGMTVPFFLLARLFGAVWITTPSMTGRILYPFSSFFIVQNKTLLPFYKKAVVASIL